MASAWKALICCVLVAQGTAHTHPTEGASAAEPQQATLQCFADSDWSQVRSAVVYVWSPRMVLSVTQAALVARAAKAQGLQFIPLVDARLPPGEWQEALQQLATPLAIQTAQRQPGGTPNMLDSVAALAPTRPLCSAQLIQLDAYRHFPTSFVVNGPSPHPSPIVGAMPQDFWTQALRLRLSHPAL